MKLYVNSLEPEERWGHQISSQVKKLWNIQLTLATKLLEVCKKHNLRIWASDGTVLGAIRHKGFIPWDDDIDFTMPREDYDKLLKIAPSEFNSPFFFQCAYTEPGYLRGHAQLRYDNTTMILPYDAHLGATYHQGIFIDIFVADGVPESQTELNELLQQLRDILTYLNYNANPRISQYSLSNLLNFKKVKKALGEKANWDDLKLYAYLEELLRKTSIKDTGRMRVLTFANLDLPSFDAQWFEDIIWVPFEQTFMPVTANYDEYLKKCYGDYMKPVKGASYHGSILLDTEKSYKEYLKQLRYSDLHLYTHFVKSIITGIFRRAFK